MTSTLLAAALFWTAAVIRCCRAKDAAQRNLAFALLAFALALTTDTPAVSSNLDRRIGIANIANLLEHCLGVVGVFFLLAALRQIDDRPPSARRHIWTLAFVLTALATCFFSAHISAEAPNFSETYGRQVAIRLYWVFTVGYFALSLVELERLTVRHARLSSRSDVRHGFIAVRWGVFVGVVYSSLKVVEVLAISTPRPIDLADHVALVIGSTLIGGGFLYPMALATVRHKIRGYEARKLLIHLRSTWAEAVKENPAIVLGPPSSIWKDMFGRDPEFRLYRRVIEIRDGLLNGSVVVNARTDLQLETAARLSRRPVATANARSR